jgi:hypothetical protein
VFVVMGLTVPPAAVMVTLTPKSRHADSAYETPYEKSA